MAVSRIEKDRGDVVPSPFTWSEIMRQFLDLKIYGFSVTLFCHVSGSNPFLHCPVLKPELESGFNRPFILSSYHVCPT